MRGLCPGVVSRWQDGRGRSGAVGHSAARELGSSFVLLAVSDKGRVQS